MTEKLQDAVFSFLGDPSTHGGHKVRRIDTHAAAIFLADDYALKVKRAVRFPFLDYSTLAKRKAACLSELEVNKAFAAQIYRRVVPITRDASGHLALDGDGEPVEWAVDMFRFDENKTLDRLAEMGGIDEALAARLAAAVVTMHAQAPRGPENPRAIVSPACWRSSFSNRENRLLHALQTWFTSVQFAPFPHKAREKTCSLSKSASGPQWPQYTQ